MPFALRTEAVQPGDRCDHPEGNSFGCVICERTPRPQYLSTTSSTPINDTILLDEDWSTPDCFVSIRDRFPDNDWDEPSFEQSSRFVRGLCEEVRAYDHELGVSDLTAEEETPLSSEFTLDGFYQLVEEQSPAMDPVSLVSATAMLHQKLALCRQVDQDQTTHALANMSALPQSLIDYINLMGSFQFEGSLYTPDVTSLYYGSQKTLQHLKVFTDALNLVNYCYAKQLGLQPEKPVPATPITRGFKPFLDGLPVTRLLSRMTMIRDTQLCIHNLPNIFPQVRFNTQLLTFYGSTAQLHPTVETPNGLRAIINRFPIPAGTGALLTAYPLSKQRVRTRGEIFTIPRGLAFSIGLSLINDQNDHGQLMILAHLSRCKLAQKIEPGDLRSPQADSAIGLPHDIPPDLSTLTLSGSRDGSSSEDRQLPPNE